MMDPIFSARQLKIGIKKLTLIDAFDFELGVGSLVALLGRNGTGKSTLIKTLSGIQAPLSGAIYIKDKHLSTLSRGEMSTEISVVFTHRVLHNLSAFELISIGRLSYAHWSAKLKSRDIEMIYRIMEDLDCLHLKDQAVHQLSDGEYQKILIGRALAQDTPIILLDEPTAFLDFSNKVKVLAWLKKLAVKYRKLVIFSSHMLTLSLQIADRIWLIHQGKMYQDTPKKLVGAGIFGEAFNTAEISYDVENQKFNMNGDFTSS